MRASTGNNLKRTVVGATGSQLTRNNRSYAGHHQETDAPITVANPSPLWERSGGSGWERSHPKPTGISPPGPRGGSQDHLLLLETTIGYTPSCPLKIQAGGQVPFSPFFPNPFTYVPNLLLPGKKRKELNVCII